MQERRNLWDTYCVPHTLQGLYVPDTTGVHDNPGDTICRSHLGDEEAEAWRG